jgi:hypothetical protein
MRRDAKEYEAKFSYKLNKLDYNRNKIYYENVDKEFVPRKTKVVNSQDVIDRYSK